MVRKRNVIPPDNDTNKVKETAPQPEPPLMKLRFVVHLIASTCLAASFWGFITDQYEVINNIEPLHWIIHGKGMIAPDYTPDNPVRSFALLSLYYPMASGYFVIRITTGLISASSFILLYRSVQRTQSSTTSLIFLMFLTFSPAIFISSAEMLPETFSMCAVFLFLSCWLDDMPIRGLMALVVSSLIGWPFTICLGVPMVVCKLLGNERSKMVSILLNLGGITIFGVLVPVILIDYCFYGEIVFPALNYIIQNNIQNINFDIYYFQSVLQIFNTVVPLSLLSLPIMFIHHMLIPGDQKRSFVSLVPVLVTPLFGFVFLFLFFPLQAVRFMFPLVPFVVFSASVAVVLLQDVCNLWDCESRVLSFILTNMSLLIVGTHMALGVLKMTSIYYSLSAPTNGFMSLNGIPYSSELVNQKDIRFCMDNPKYFASNFLFPGNNWTLYLTGEPVGLGINTLDSTKYCHFIAGTELDVVGALGSRNWSVFFNSSMTIFDKFDNIWWYYIPWFSKQHSTNFIILDAKNFSLVEQY